MKNTKTLSLVTIFIITSMVIAGCSSDSSDPVSPGFANPSARSLTNLYTAGGNGGEESAVYNRDKDEFVVNIPAAGYYAIEYYANGNFPFYLAFQAMKPVKVSAGMPSVSSSGASSIFTCCST